MYKNACVIFCKKLSPVCNRGEPTRSPGCAWWRAAGVIDRVSCNKKTPLIGSACCSLCQAQRYLGSGNLPSYQLLFLLWSTGRSCVVEPPLGQGFSRCPSKLFCFFSCFLSVLQHRLFDLSRVFFFFFSNSFIPAGFVFSSVQRAIVLISAFFTSHFFILLFFFFFGGKLPALPCLWLRRSPLPFPLSVCIISQVIRSVKTFFIFF